MRAQVGVDLLALTHAPIIAFARNMVGGYFNFSSQKIGISLLSGHSRTTKAANYRTYFYFRKGH